MRIIKTKNEILALSAVILVFFVLSLTFIFSSGVLSGGVKYYSLFDDVMISMRYAKHLAHGNGLVWNIGEQPVEGFSNQFWVVIMAVFHVFSDDISKIPMYFQLFCLLLLVINIIYVYKTAKLLYPEKSSVALLSAVYSAGYYPMNFWGLIGMESAILMPMISLSLYYLLKLRAKKKYGSGYLILPALMLLIRLDTLVILIVFGLFCYFIFPYDRKRIIAEFFLSSLILAGGLTLFRYFYFGDILPNTYYLKLTGYPFLARLARGGYVSLKFLGFIAPIVLMTGVYLWKSADKKAYMLLSLFMVQIIYTVYAGGDAWEWWGGCNRFIGLVMPEFLILTAVATIWLSEKLKDLLNKFIPKRSFILTIIVALALLNLNSPKGTGFLIEALPTSDHFVRRDNARSIKIYAALDKIISPDASYLVNTAGTVPYFLERKAVDLLGKNDKRIAGLQMKYLDNLPETKAFVPGHLKWDYTYSIGQLKPDVITGLWMRSVEAQKLLDSLYELKYTDGFYFWFLKNSKNIVR